MGQWIKNYFSWQSWTLGTETNATFIILENFKRLWGLAELMLVADKFNESKQFKQFWQQNLY